MSLFLIARIFWTKWVSKRRSGELTSPNGRCGCWNSTPIQIRAHYDLIKISHWLLNNHTLWDYRDLCTPSLYYLVCTGAESDVLINVHRRGRTGALDKMWHFLSQVWMKEVISVNTWKLWRSQVRQGFANQEGKWLEMQWIGLKKRPENIWSKNLSLQVKPSHSSLLALLGSWVLS